MVWAVFAVILGILGIIGSIVPAIPGPPLSWLGLLCAFFAGGTRDGSPMGLTALLVWLGVVIVVTVLDYVVPAKFTRMAGASRTAGRGALAGMLVGMLVPPVGIVLGGLLGAFAAEFLFEKKDAATSAKASLAALMGFLAGTGLKLIVTGLLLYQIIVYAF